MSAYDPKKIKILLVEDQASMRKIEIKILKGLGFESIVEAEDGSVAIDLLQDNDDIDLIISDWNMPNKGGYDLLIWVRAYKKYRDIPFIMATGQSDRDQVSKAEKAGVSGFIPKPFTAEELWGKIEAVFGVGEAEAVLPAGGPVMASSGKVQLRVAHIQITDHLILGVLKDKIDRGEVSPKYFELSTSCFTSWNSVEQGLDKGAVDAAFVLAPIALDLFAHGVPIKLTLLAHKNGSTCVRNTEGSYAAAQHTEFFKGKSFLIPHKMSAHHMMAHMFFDKIGLKASLEKGDDIDVNLEVVAPIAMPDFLKNGQEVAGFMVAEPISSKAIAAGISEMLFASGELWANHPCCVVAVRDDFAGPHQDAVYEFTEMLVEAGKNIAELPEESARIGVNFLDPEGKLGLTASVLTKVLTTPNGIITSDLFPIIQDFDNMQRYMHDVMRAGTLVDLEKLIDSRYAEAACQDLHISAGKFNNQPDEIAALLHRSFSAASIYRFQIENNYVMVYRN